MKIIVILSLFLMSLTACVKKYGCTDQSAVNYDLGAELEDYTCYYKRPVNFYWEATDAYKYALDGIDSLEIFLNNESVAVTTIESTIPNSVIVDRILYSDETPVNLTVVSQLGDTLRNEQIVIYIYDSITDVHLYHY